MENKISKNLYLVILSLLSAGIVGSLLVLSSYFLPTNSIQNNVTKSLQIYDIEKDRYAWAPSIISSQMDNWTDAIIINISAFEKGNNLKEVIHNAMLNPQYASKFNYKSDNLRYAYAKGVNRTNLSHYQYGRYWHGYVIFMKPLLTFFTVSDIRMLNMVLQTLLLLFLMLELYKTGGIKLALPFLLAILIFNPISCALCIQYACIYYITLFSSIIFLKKKLYKSSYYWLFFLWLGIITSFFDLLTYPLAALGCNLILLIILTNYQLIYKLKKCIIASALWCIGYIGMWSEKWIIGYLLTGNNIILDAMNSIKIRTIGDISYSNNSIFSAIYRNITAFDNHFFYALLFLGLVLLVVLYLTGKYKIKTDFSIIVPLCMVAIYPFVWFIVLRNHSYIHYWLTHKILMITIIALIYIIVYSIEKNTPESQINIFNYRMWQSNFIICIKRVIIILILAIISFVITYFFPTTSRIDIYTKYSESPIFNVKTGNKGKNAPEASWMPNGGNRGVVVQQMGNSLDFTITALEDTDITIALRGPDERDANGKRYEKWVKYTSFTINGKQILSANQDVWHDKPFKHILKAKKNNAYKVNLKYRKK